VLVSTTIATQEHPGGAADAPPCRRGSARDRRRAAKSPGTPPCSCRYKAHHTTGVEHTTRAYCACGIHRPRNCATCDPQMQHVRHKRMPCHRDLANIADWLCGHSETTPTAVSLRASAAARAGAGFKWPQPCTTVQPKRQRHTHPTGYGGKRGRTR
jgi:hypothetical protein